jgi:YidC/Oxa1 family membrane protein insertase
VPSGPGDEPRPAIPDVPEEPEEPEDDPVIIGPIETDELLLEFNTLGASVERAALLKHHFLPGDEEPLDVLLPIGGLGGASNSFVLRSRDESTLEVDLSRRVWKLAEDSGYSQGRRRIVFRTRVGKIEFVKTYALQKTGLVFGVDVEIRNTSAAPVAGLAFDMIAMNGIAPDDRPGRYWNLQATLAGRRSDDADVTTKKLAAAKLVGSGVEGLENFQDRSYSPPVKEWLALTNHYFAAIFQVTDSDGIETMSVEPVVFEARIRYYLADIQVSDRATHYRRNDTDLAVYDNSMSEWATNESLPIEKD